PNHSLLIFITGAVILGLELTASRYMSPMFGSSLYIWGAILSITLLCLSAGYSWGGRLGENLDKPVQRLLLFVLITAAWIGLLPFFQRPVALLGLHIGPTFGPLLVMILLFALPVLLLATATPLVFADNNRARNGKGAATVMGNLFALSTIGSVFGALTTAYALIPMLGLRTTLFALAIVLLVAAAPYVLKGMHIRTASNLVILVALAQLVYQPDRSSGVNSDFQIIHQTSSGYGEIAVLQHRKNGSRILLLDGTSQNWLSGENFEVSNFEHTAVIDSQIQQYPTTNKKALVLGLGAGFFTRHLTRLGWSVDSVEIDPVVHRVAKKYFGLAPSIPVYIQDGRTFVEAARQRGQTYGLIIFDIFSGGGQPAHLFTVDALESMAAILSEDGVIITNRLLTLASERNDLALYSLATQKAVFPHVRGFDVYPDEPETQLTNFVVFSSKVAPTSLSYRSRIGEKLYLANTQGIEVISDNWNPSEIWAIDVSRQWHSTIQEWLGEGAVIPM
ncbi:MAG: fused MFS/spermidine synthase, partial [Gammaproteobacteria bacterium]|nr:fused MFS/spermidine synthase [Gammaproteobacteria bacterium]